ncbi:class I SAM-dependent methyltransferase [Gordonia neofelifaecis]|uniref:Type 11 methyltransferase n=1 Tax=Gordonia neofelifaecis NRRL B-59395 TaxID=644548 RepID=F1YL57_9ACTN|nr:class I SAM-dependent methyltransferase [Gordonia neofelifaecis]EGD54517.1 type 11 methyltransferase [Gordonia neofelifaecis NRRL B-59395]
MTDHQHHHEQQEAPRHPVSAEEWDELYQTSDRLWTTNVNPAVIAEISDLAPGSAFDLGCGEGADARWLADRGWTVVGADISKVALERAAAADSRETIIWLPFDVTVDSFDRQYDLVTAGYFHIASDDEGTLHKLADAVAPGGTLLVVMHDPEGMRAHGRSPDGFLWPDDMVAMLGDSWTVVTNENRERGIPAGGGHHVNDVVLRMVRDA